MIEIIIFLLIYLLPYMNACFNRHNNQRAIGVATILTGWTIFGWIFCMIWSCTDNVKPKKPKAHQK